MNKRQKKKFNGKLRIRGYEYVRLQHILDYVNTYLIDHNNDEENENGHTMIYIETPKSGSLKRPLDVKILTNIQLVSSNHTGIDKHEQEIEFNGCITSTPESDVATRELASMYDDYMQYLNSETLAIQERILMDILKDNGIDYHENNDDVKILIEDNYKKKHIFIQGEYKGSVVIDTDHYPISVHRMVLENIDKLKTLL